MSRAAMAIMWIALIAVGCSSGVVRQPEDRRWDNLRAQWETIEAIRASHPVPDATRREQIEALVERQRRLEPVYMSFISALREYVEETSDPRAASMFSRERMLMGDEYATYLARYDRAIEMYQSALVLDPGNKVIQQKIEDARERLFLSPRAFSRVQPGMGEKEVVALLGYPRADWVKETIRNRRVYSVWIYPKEDGGAGAVYFDNGVVYHKNWEASRASEGS